MHVFFRRARKLLKRLSLEKPIYCIEYTPKNTFFESAEFGYYGEIIYTDATVYIVKSTKPKNIMHQSLYFVFLHNDIVVKLWTRFEFQKYSMTKGPSVIKRMELSAVFYALRQSATKVLSFVYKNHKDLYEMVIAQELDVLDAGYIVITTQEGVICAIPAIQVIELVNR